MKINQEEAHYILMAFQTVYERSFLDSAEKDLISKIFTTYPELQDYSSFRGLLDIITK